MQQADQEAATPFKEEEQGGGGSGGGLGGGKVAAAWGGGEPTAAAAEETGDLGEVVVDWAVGLVVVGLAAAVGDFGADFGAALAVGSVTASDLAAAATVLTILAPMLRPKPQVRSLSSHAGRRRQCGAKWF